MKKHGSALALAALLATPAAHAATAVDFNGEFEVNAFNVDLGDATPAGEDDRRGLQQLLRLGANVKLDDGVQIVTRMNLRDNTWEGDQAADAAGNTPFSPDAGDSVSLDLGYVQLPIGPGVLRVGRQESNWGICFLSCDDRRDRIQWAGRVGGVSAGLGYDKRREFNGAVDDDVTGYYGFAIGKVGPALAGLLVYHTRYDESFAANPVQADENSTTISPYAQAKLGGVELSGAFVYQDLSYSDDTPMGGFLRAGYDLGVAKVEGQAVWTDEGYAPNQGFDTFSSMVNNSPENNQSPTTVARLGGEAVAYAVRVSGNVTNQVKLVGAAGMTDAYRFGAATTDVDDDATFFDLQAHYQFSPSTLVWATLGRVSPDDGDDVDAMSLNVQTKF